jgi:hypothetical protein
MSHKFLIPFLTAAFLVAQVVLPRALVSAIAPSFSGAAQAATTVNSSRSNTYRTVKTRSPVTTPKAGGGVERMGGGGGARGGAERMGGGGGARGGGALMGGGGGARMGGGGGASTK